MQDANTPIIDAVRVAMARKRLSQEALASLIGMNRGKLQRRLSGEVEFTVTELKRIAAQTDTTLTALAADAEAVAS